MDMTNKTLEHFKNKYVGDYLGSNPVHLYQVNRLEMARTMAELGFRVGAEVGVAAGDHSKTLCENIPGLVLHCIDPWKQVDGYLSFNDEKLEMWRKEAYSKLVGYDCKFFEETSMEAVKRFKNRSFDFVYIDGAHDFRHIAEDIYEWFPKVRSGGIIYGHDFINILGGKYPCHVKSVVEAYAISHEIPQWYLLTKSEVIKEKFSENIPSWMFIC